MNCCTRHETKTRSINWERLLKDINPKFLDDRVAQLDRLIEVGNLGEALSLAFKVGDDGAWEAWLSIYFAFSSIEPKSTEITNLSKYFDQKYAIALQKAADDGDENAQWRILDAYLFGSQSFISADEARGYEILLKFAEKGYPEAQATLGDYLLSGLFSETIGMDIREAKKWLTMAAQANNEKAILYLRQIAAWEDIGKPYPGHEAPEQLSLW